LGKFFNAFPKQAVFFDAALTNFGSVCQSFFFAGLFVDHQQEEIDRDNRRADKKHQIPGELPQLNRHQWPQPTTDVHRLIKDTPGDGRILPVDGFDNRALNARFKNTCTKCHDNGPHQKTGIGWKKAHNQITDDLENRRCKDCLFISDTVGYAARENRYKGLHQGPDKKDHTKLAFHQPQSTSGLGVGNIEAGTGAHTIVREPFNHLHATTNPEYI